MVLKWLEVEGEWLPSTKGAVPPRSSFSEPRGRGEVTSRRTEEHNSFDSLDMNEKGGKVSILKIGCLENTVRHRQN